MAGGSNSAQQQAQAQQAAQDARNAQTVGQVESIYNSPQRAKDISNFTSSLRDYYNTNLDQQKAINDRQLKFALARNGQIGSSTQVDQSAQLNKDYQQGLLKSQQQASAAGAQLQAQDQSSESSLITAAQAGLNATTAAQEAAANMRTSLQSGMATAQAQGLGDAFGDLSKVYDASKTAQQQRSADKFYDLYMNLMGNTMAPSSVPATY